MNGEDMRDIWTALNEIKRDTGTTLITVARLEERLAAHVAEREIHTTPPCDAHKSLSARLWAVAMLALAALAASVRDALR